MSFLLPLIESVAPTLIGLLGSELVGSGCEDHVPTVEKIHAEPVQKNKVPKNAKKLVLNKQVLFK